MKLILRSKVNCVICTELLILTVQQLIFGFLKTAINSQLKSSSKKPRTLVIIKWIGYNKIDSFLKEMI